MKRIHNVLLAAAVVLVAAGCQSKLTHQELIPPGLKAARSHSGAAEVRVTGKVGISGNLSSAEILSEAEWHRAIREALVQSGVFAGGVVDRAGDYELEVDLINADTPGAGLNMTAAYNTRWKLIRKSTGQTLFEDFIRGSYTATVGEKFVGASRYMLANRKAAQSVIEQGIRRLERLKL